MLREPGRRGRRHLRRRLRAPPLPNRVLVAQWDPARKSPSHLHERPAEGARMSGQVWTGNEGPFGQWLGVEPGSGGSGGWQSSPAGARDTDDTQTSARILLVEDEPDVREAVQSILEDQGYRVTAAENGWEALELLRSGRAPDVIVLDLRMPIMDGWEF